MQKNISVVINTNDTAAFLEKVLFGYNTQTYRNFELFIVCAKNDEAINEIASSLKNEVFYKIKVIRGGIKEVLEAAGTDYLLFSHGNCIPRADFVEQHIKRREEGFYLTGSSIPVKDIAAADFTAQNLYTGNAFKSYTNAFNSGLCGSILNRVIAVGAKWNIDNASAWKTDVETALQNTEITSSFGNNLKSAGIKPRQVGFSAICLCLNN